MANTDKCLFEASWEVCNKVGGIYTVVMSKAALVNERLANYHLIGPYFEEKARLDLEELEVPEEFKENIPRFLFDEYFASEAQGNKQQIILHQFMDQATAQEMVTDSGEMPQPIFEQTSICT